MKMLNAHKHLVWLLFFGLFFLVFNSATAQNQYTAHLNAMQKYRAGDFEGAFEILRPTLDQSDVPSDLLWNAGAFAFEAKKYEIASLVWEAATRKPGVHWKKIEWLKRAYEKLPHSTQSIPPVSGGSIFSFLLPWGVKTAVLISGLVFIVMIMQRKLRPVLGVFLIIFVVLNFLKFYKTTRGVVYCHLLSSSLYIEPRQDALKVADIKLGDRFLLLERGSGWSKVENSTGNSLWILSSDMIEIQ